MSFAHYLAARNHLYTGRASAAIYLVLQANGIRGAQVLVPANICYAAVLPILCSGNVPVFADVGDDGNLTPATLGAVSAGNLAAIILPHMYGNPCRDTIALCDSLRRRGALVIEDCALAMGASLDDQMAGTFGDYAVFSFGYAKTIDCGYGGLLVSSRSLDRLADLNEGLGSYEPRVEADLQFLSQLYRVLRNNPEASFAPHIYDSVREHFGQCFLFKASTAHCARLHESLGQLDAVIQRRRENARLYEQSIRWNSHVAPYRFGAGAVPWRYNILVEEQRRPGLLRHLLQQRIAVSDWYPVIAPMFRVYDEFPKAKWMEIHILNFPLIGITPVEIENIAHVINESRSEV